MFDCIQVAIFVLHHTTFADLVREAFGFSYDIRCIRQPADSIVEYRAIGTTDAMRNQVERLRSGQRVNDPNILLNALVDVGVIPPGAYRISLKPSKPTITRPARPWSLGQLRVVGMQV